MRRLIYGQQELRYGCGSFGRGLEAHPGLPEGWEHLGATESRGPKCLEPILEKPATKKASLEKFTILGFGKLSGKLCVGKP